MPTKSNPNLFIRYQQLVKEKRIKNDSAQQQLIGLLQKVIDSFAARRKKSLFRKEKPRRSCSIYIHGKVGRGKSMLMDLFFEAAPVEKKRRVHFHDFMQEVHARIHKLRQSRRGDPVAVLAQEIAVETRLLCFDELQATDVADATLLYRLFEGLFANGVCIISTSNRPPEALYTGSVQAERFEKFIKLIEEKMLVAALSSPEDYRYQQGSSTHKLYHYPLGKEADEFIEQSLQYLGANSAPETETLIVHGRQVEFTAYNGKIALIDFDYLCRTALGAADYLALSRRVSALILTGIPKLSADERNAAKRFTTLVDTLYENNVKLICTAAVPPEKIYEYGDGSFEFKRTVSRLAEMQSAGYAIKQETI